MSWNSRRAFPPAVRIVGAAIVVTAVLAPWASAQTLIGSPFITGFEGWQSTWPGSPIVGNPPSWSVLLTPDPFTGQRFLMESSDGREADGVTTAGVPDGKYEPYKLINTLDMTPANYTITYQLATVDNDGFGLVFGYQDEDNYFRVGFREQAGSNLGFGTGTSVQKVVGGVITQIAAPSLSFVPNSGGTPFEAKVIVTGTSWDVQVAPTVGGTFTSIHSGNDASLQPGKYGIHSWAQREVNGTTSPQYGTIFGPITVSSTTLNKTTDFANAVSSIPWRRLVMVNSNFETGFEQPPGTGNANDDHGNFAQGFLNGTIFDDSNGNVNATTVTPNIDFMGPAIVVDQAGAESLTNYRYTVRVENRDNDGIGLLYRVDAANNFYRINWNTEGPAIGVGTSATRPPLGMSIQKYKDGLWSEIFRDDQTNPVFLPADSVPFDVSIQAIGNQFKIDVLNDPDGAPQAISYGVIADNSGDPILAGSVGFTNWGNGDSNNGAVYSAHNGNSTSLVTALSTILDLKLEVNRNTGNVMLINSGASPSNIKGVTLQSSNGTLNPANWLSITDNYDEAPQNGSVDMDDPWTKLTITDFNLAERENSGGNGGVLTAGQMVDLGNVWRKSRIEDLVLSVELTNGDVVVGEVSYIMGPGGNSYSRSDLNADGSVNEADWGIFFPNMLTNISAQSGYNRAIKGDLDLDGDNDGVDFGLFKADYDFFNGAGAFDELLGTVPEPASALLVLLAAFAACGLRQRRRIQPFVMGLSVVALLSLGNAARAVPLDLTTFGTENYPKADAGFPVAVWNLTPTTASLQSNADATVLYTPANVVNKRITGTLTPGTDDDVVGFVVGFEPGDSAIGSSADYFLIDWKGATQAFDFVDSGGGPVFHNLTGSSTMPVGLALNRVTGSPNADEMWQHAGLAANPSGSIVQLARGATLGSTAYDRTGGSHLFDISITDKEVIVKVDGVEQFATAGTFAAGRFGLYSAFQGPTATFSDFDSVDFDGSILRATVNRSDGTITLDNPFSTAAPFDFYQFSSASNSLNPAQGVWNSLHDQNFQPAGGGAHQQWQEAGGSSTAAIAEVFLAGNSTLAGNTSQGIGLAYNNLINGQDLVFQYRLPTGELRTGFVNYIGVAPLQGDYNGNGKVDAADYVLWRKNPAAYGGNPGGYNTWRANFGTGAGSGSSLGGASVPEPGTLGLYLCVGLIVAVERRRRSK